jgi:hypothetical protein
MQLTTHLHLRLRSRMHGATPPLPQYAIMAWCLVKQRNNFTFNFTIMELSPTCYFLFLRYTYSSQNVVVKHPQFMFFPQRGRSNSTPIEHNRPNCFVHFKLLIYTMSNNFSGASQMRTRLLFFKYCLLHTYTMV